MHWGNNYDLKKQAHTRIGRPFNGFIHYGAYIITDLGCVEITRLKNNEEWNDYKLVLNYTDIATQTRFVRWYVKEYSDRYLVTLCKRFAAECYNWSRK